MQLLKSKQNQKIVSIILVLVVVNAMLVSFISNVIASSTDITTAVISENFETGYSVGQSIARNSTFGKNNVFKAVFATNNPQMKIVEDPLNTANKCLQMKVTGNDNASLELANSYIQDENGTFVDTLLAFDLLVDNETVFTSTSNSYDGFVFSVYDGSNVLIYPLVGVPRVNNGNVGSSNILATGAPTCQQKNVWYSFKLLSKDNILYLKAWEKSSPEPEKWQATTTAITNIKSMVKFYLKTYPRNAGSTIVAEYDNLKICRLGTNYSNADLSNISVDGVKFADFSPSKTDYEFEAPFGTYPKFSAETFDPLATYSVETPATYPGVVKISAKSYDASKTYTYTINVKYAETTIDSVSNTNDISCMVDSGFSSLILPNQVEVKLATGGLINLNVNWKEPDGFSNKKVGDIFTVYGDIVACTGVSNIKQVKASIKIKVLDIYKKLFVDNINGNDSNAEVGNIDKPFKTIEAAKLVAQNLTQNMIGDIYIYLRGGTYTIEKPLSFTSIDSGKNGFNIVYQNYQNEEVIFSGGKKITNKWEQDPDSAKIYRTFVGTKVGQNIPNTNQNVENDFYTANLYVNGVNAKRAQGSPPENVFLYNPDFGFVLPSAATPYCNMNDWRNITDIEISQNTVWSIQRGHLQYISDGKIYLDPVFLNKSINRKSGLQLIYPQKIINAYELLDEQGEWYLDRNDGYLYYIPKAGEKFNDQTMEIDGAEFILGSSQFFVDGNSTGSLNSMLQNVRFSGITFSYTTWKWPFPEAGYVGGQGGSILSSDAINSLGPPKAIMDFKYSKNITIDNCNFKELAGTVLNVTDATSNFIITNNKFENLGRGAIWGGTMKLASSPALASSNINFIYNLVHDVGKVYPDCAAIQGRYTYAWKVEHNTVYNTTYSGICLNMPGSGASQDGINGANSIAFNRLENCMSELIDGSSIYVATIQNPASRVYQNYIAGSGYIKHGVYVDNDTQNYFIENNVIDNTYGRTYDAVYTQSTQFCFNNKIINNYVSKGMTIVNGVDGNFVDGNVQVENNLWPLEAKKIIDNAGSGDKSNPTYYVVTKDIQNCNSANYIPEKNENELVKNIVQTKEFVHNGGGWHAYTSASYPGYCVQDAFNYGYYNRQGGTFILPPTGNTNVVQKFVSISSAYAFPDNSGIRNSMVGGIPTTGFDGLIFSITSTGPIDKFNFSASVLNAGGTANNDIYFYDSSTDEITAPETTTNFKLTNAVGKQMYTYWIIAPFSNGGNDKISNFNIFAQLSSSMKTEVMLKMSDIYMYKGDYYKAITNAITKATDPILTKPEEPTTNNPPTNTDDPIIDNPNDDFVVDDKLFDNSQVFESIDETTLDKLISATTDSVVVYKSKTVGTVTSSMLTKLAEAGKTLKVCIYDDAENLKYVWELLSIDNPTIDFEIGFNSKSAFEKQIAELIKNMKNDKGLSLVEQAQLVSFKQAEFPGKVRVVLPNTMKFSKVTRPFLYKYSVEKNLLEKLSTAISMSSDEKFLSFELDSGGEVVLSVNKSDKTTVQPNKFSLIPIIFIFVVLLFIGSIGIFIYSKKRKENLNNSEKEDN